MASTGELNCVTAVEDASNSSLITLQNLTNLSGDTDPNTAVSQTSNGSPSRWCLCGFAAPSIPVGSTPLGAIVRMTAWRTGGAGAIPNAQAALNGTINGTVLTPPTIDTNVTTFTLGDGTSFLGVSPSLADLNNQLFQFAFTMSQLAPGGARVGKMTVEYFYDPPAATDNPAAIIIISALFGLIRLAMCRNWSEPVVRWLLTHVIPSEKRSETCTATRLGVQPS